MSLFDFVLDMWKRNFLYLGVGSVHSSAVILASSCAASVPTVTALSSFTVSAAFVKIALSPETNVSSAFSPHTASDQFAPSVPPPYTLSSDSWVIVMSPSSSIPIMYPSSEHVNFAASEAERLVPVTSLLASFTGSAERTFGVNTNGLSAVAFTVTFDPVATANASEPEEEMSNLNTKPAPNVTSPRVFVSTAPLSKTCIVPPFSESEMVSFVKVADERFIVPPFMTIAPAANVIPEDDVSFIVPESHCNAPVKYWS